MRIRSLIAAGFILAGLPLLAQDAHQSYITYDDSDSVLVQSDGREVDARVNLPVYPGDEVRAARRGRTELRLADGNIIALDRDSIVKFESMLMNYEEGGEQTVIALANGHAIVYRGYEGAEPLRLDSPNASFVSDRESIYGVETNSRGIDVVTVFEGSVEVRTPKGTTLLSAGERAKIDPTGVYDRRAISNVAASEFERWFLLRAERYANKTSRHLDASLAYAADELDENGRWVYVKDYDQWAWSPYVSAGWKPYNYGYWGWGANGSCWISYEPWGWVPYHYGSWSFVSNHGWIWFPGSVYAPAWVYWAWGPSWVGWVPWGYYSYYGGYYPWLYDPYCDPRVYGHYGFNGHINVSSGDLRAYTVVDRTTLFSNRVDRAALSADAVRDRLARDGGRANFTNQPIRANRTDMKDPSTAVDRIIRGSRDGSGTGSVGAGSSGDLTQFFQRDPALPQDIRTRVTRGQSSPPAGTTTTTVRGRNTMPGSIGGTTNPATTTQPGRGGVRGGGGTGGTVDRPGSPGSTTGSTTPATGTTIPRGGGTSTVPRGGGSTSGGTTSPDTNTSAPPTRNRPVDGVTPRTQTPDTPSDPAPRGGTDTPTVERPSAGGTTSSSDGTWRGRPARSGSASGSSGTTGATTSNPRTTVRGGGDDPVSRPSTSGSTSSSTSTSPRGSSSGDSWRGAGDTVRRVIGSIGGARLTPSDSRGSTSSGTRSGSSSTRSGSGSSSTRSGSGSSSTRGGSGSSSTRGSSGSSGSGSVSRPSSGSSSSGSSSSSSGGSSRSSGSSGSSSSSPSSSGGGGKVNRGG